MAMGHYDHHAIEMVLPICKAQWECSDNTLHNMHL